MKPRNWKAALRQPRFYVLESFKWTWAVVYRKINSKMSISRLEPLTKFTCKIWTKLVNLSVRRFSIWLHFYGLLLLSGRGHPLLSLNGLFLLFSTCIELSLNGEPLKCDLE